MEKNRKFFIVSPFIVVQTTTSAGIRWEPEPSDDDGEGVPDWIAYLLLMIVVLIMAGKFK